MLVEIINCRDIVYHWAAFSNRPREETLFSVAGWNIKATHTITSIICIVRASISTIVCTRWCQLVNPRTGIVRIVIFEKGFIRVSVTEEPE